MKRRARLPTTVEQVVNRVSLRWRAVHIVLVRMVSDEWHHTTSSWTRHDIEAVYESLGGRLCVDAPSGHSRRVAWTNPLSGTVRAYWRDPITSWFTAPSGVPLDLLWARDVALETIRRDYGYVIRRGQFLYHTTALGESVGLHLQSMGVK